MDNSNEAEEKSAADSGGASTPSMSSADAVASEPLINPSKTRAVELIESPALAIVPLQSEVPKSDSSAAQAPTVALDPAVLKIEDSDTKALIADAPGAEPAKPSAKIPAPTLDWIKSTKEGSP